MSTNGVPVSCTVCYHELEPMACLDIRYSAPRQVYWEAATFCSYRCLTLWAIERRRQDEDSISR